MAAEATASACERDAMNDSIPSDRAALVRLLPWLLAFFGGILAGGYCVAHGVGLASLAVGPMTDEQRDELHSWAAWIMTAGIGFFVTSFGALAHLCWSVWKERRSTSGIERSFTGAK
jgi:hypothetical protein